MRSSGPDLPYLQLPPPFLLTLCRSSMRGAAGKWGPWKTRSSRSARPLDPWRGWFRKGMARRSWRSSPSCEHGLGVPVLHPCDLAQAYSGAVCTCACCLSGFTLQRWRSMEGQTSWCTLLVRSAAGNTCAQIKVFGWCTLVQRALPPPNLCVSL